MMGRPVGTEFPLLVLHAVGDREGGAPWAEGFAAAGWEGPVLAPDLPGHAGAPPPISGGYELADAAFAAVPWLLECAWDVPPFVLGVGCSGWAATLLALGGRASGLALVDGLGGPWRSAGDDLAANVAWTRAVAEDEIARSGAFRRQEGAALDPRLRHGSPLQTNLGLALRSVASLTVPFVAISTPHDPLLDDDPVRLAVAARASMVVVGEDEADPAVVAGFVTSWWANRKPIAAH